MNRKILIIISIVCIIIVSYIVSNVLLNREKNQSNKESKSFFSIPEFKGIDINNKEVRLTDYKGKVIIIHFWATFCESCFLEMPILNEINEEYKEKNFILLGISPYSTGDYVKEYSISHKHSFNTVIDVDNKIFDLYKITSYPTTLVIDQNGNLVKRINESTSKEHLKDIIDKLLK